ncbi:MAG: aldehyde dehydrogenase family protein, partial [Bacteroidota bacterium]
MDSLHAISFPVDLIPRWFEKQKLHSLTLREQSVEQRIRKLRRMRQWIKRHRSSIQDAIYQDFRKPRFETDGTEILVILQEINHTIKHLKEWTQPTKVETPLILSGTSSWVQYESKGVCLIIAPWNYPFQLLVSPWISAIAAGNCCVLKPSEMSPHTSELIFEMAAALFHPKEALAVQGDKEVAEAL